MSKIMDISTKVEKDATKKLSKMYTKLLKGKHLYKSGCERRKSSYLGTITEVLVSHFSSIGDANLCVKVNGNQFITMYGVNLNDYDAGYGWYYKDIKEEVK